MPSLYSPNFYKPPISTAPTFTSPPISTTSSAAVPCPASARKPNIPQAAAVFEVGAVEQSPRANTFLYLTCCSDSLSTCTKLLASTSGQFHSTDGVDIGGAMCSIEYWTQTDIVADNESNKIHFKSPRLNQRWVTVKYSKYFVPFHKLFMQDFQHHIMSSFHVFTARFIIKWTSECQKNLRDDYKINCRSCRSMSGNLQQTRGVPNSGFRLFGRIRIRQR